MGFKIGFAGSMNAMPMMYAKNLKELGYDVKYLVDINRSNLLSRPEYHFEEINYPYPSWIIESIIRFQQFRALYPKLLFRKHLDILSDCNIVFLCDWYISVAPYLDKNTKVVLLPHGADFDMWCDTNKIDYLSKIGRFKRFKLLKRLAVKLAIGRMVAGAKRADLICYFPEGLNPSAEILINSYSNLKNNTIRRFDVNLSIYNSHLPKLMQRTDRLIICSAVRFDFAPLRSSDTIYNKGNDVAIRGIARFIFSYKGKVKVIFFNKGQDLSVAKDLCSELGIDKYVEWLDQVPLTRLLKIISDSDICFDQTGSHWLGAVGVSALLMERPLIANYRPEVFDDFFVGKNPICQASNEVEVYEQLLRLSNYETRCYIGKVSREFAKNNFDSMKVTNLLKKQIDLWNK